MLTLPGKSIFNPPKPQIEEPPPVPKRDDPEIAKSRKKLRESELRRKGRASTIITGGQGVEEPLGEAQVSRPRAAQLLGN